MKTIIHDANQTKHKALPERTPKSPVNRMSQKPKGLNIPSRETLAKIFQRGSLDDQLVNLLLYCQSHIGIEITS